MAGAMLTGGDVTPVPAASVLVLRDEPLQVLMLRRHEKSSFVPNAWVFPGGIAEPTDHDLAGNELDAMRVAGVRETFEETGLWLGAPLQDADHKRRRLLAGSVSFRQIFAEVPVDLETLVWTSRWITPVGIPKRFDTYFFAAKITHAADATPQEEEAVEVAWLTPKNALARHAAGEMPMVFPTLRTLESLLRFDTAAALLDAHRGATIEPILPVLVDGKPTLR